MAKINVIPSDTIKTKRSTTSIMLELFGALVVLLAAAVAYYAIQGKGDAGRYILRIFLNLLVSFGTSAVLEAANLLIRRPKSIEANGKIDLRSALRQFAKTYFYITPLLTVLLFPVYTPVYVIFVSTVVGVMVAKLLFGGFGHNVFNPALVGRMFATLCFSTQLGSATTVGGAATDLTSGATINSIAASSHWVIDPNISLANLFLGNYRGALGETFAFLLIALGIYLMIRGVIDARLTVTYVVSFYIISLIMGFCIGRGAGSFEFAFRQICYGGVLFGAVFCLTDPVTSPVQGTGKVIFALTASIITAFIRYLGAAPEGVAYSILAVNMLTPAIDRLLSHKSNHKMWAQYTAIGVCAAIALGAGLGTGLYLKDFVKSDESPTREAASEPAAVDLVMAGAPTTKGFAE